MLAILRFYFYLCCFIDILLLFTCLKISPPLVLPLNALMNLDAISKRNESSICSISYRIKWSETFSQYYQEIILIKCALYRLYVLLRFELNLTKDRTCNNQLTFYFESISSGGDRCNASQVQGSLYYFTEVQSSVHYFIALEFLGSLKIALLINLTWQHNQLKDI